MSKNGSPLHTAVQGSGTQTIFYPCSIWEGQPCFMLPHIHQRQHWPSSGSTSPLSQTVLTPPVVAWPWPATKYPSSRSFTLPYLPGRIVEKIRVEKMRKTGGLRSRQFSKWRKRKKPKQTSEAKAMTHHFPQAEQCPQADQCPARPWATATVERSNARTGKIQRTHTRTRAHTHKHTAVIAEHNVLWQGIHLWSIWFSCQAKSTPNLLPTHSHPPLAGGIRVSNRESLDTVQIQFSNRCSIGVLSVEF